MKDGEIIQAARRMLESLVLPPNDLRIEAESSYSEAVLIGTKAAYVQAAIVFLGMALEGAGWNHDETGSEPINERIKYSFDENGAVWPVWGYVVESPEAAVTLAKVFSPRSQDA